MASTCDFYKDNIKLGSGTCAAGSASITSYTALNPGLAHDVARVAARRNIRVVITQAGTHAGRHWNARVLSEGSTCTLSNPCPYVGA